MYLLERVVGRPRVEPDEAPGIARALRHDTEPLLVHVVFALYEVIRIPPVGPRRVRIVHVQVSILQILPPAITPLEGETADRVTDLSLSCRLLIDLLPLA